METSLFHLDLTSRLVPIEAWLNDIPVWRMDGRTQGFFSLAAHSFLCEGDNTIELIICPGSSPRKVRQPPSIPPPRASSCSARLAKYRPGDRLGQDGSTVSQVEWSYEQTSDVSFPSSRKVSFSLSSMFGKWAWESAQKLDLQRDSKMIHDTLAEIYRLFRLGDGQQLLERYCDIYFKEEATAYPARSEEQMKHMFVRQVSANTMADVNVLPINPDDWDLRLCANGRLIECVDKKWQPLLRADRPPDMGEFSLPIFLGLYEGRFQILR